MTEFHSAYRGLGERLKAARPDALVIVAAEHFANFFMNNMPSFAIGMVDQYEGPIEDPDWLRIARTTIPGNASLARRLVGEMMNTVDLAYAEEWKFDHGIMVPLHFLTPNFDLPVDSNQHQLPGSAVGTPVPRLGARGGAAPSRRLGSASASPW